MNTQTFLKQALQRDIRLSVHGDKLDVDAPKKALTPDVLEYLKAHKAEIIDTLRPPLACLLRLPDDRQFWVAPDGMDFDSRDIPVIRHSVIDKLTSSGADIKTEIMRLIDGLHILGGEVFISGGATPLPNTQKAVTGDLRKSDHG